MSSGHVLWVELWSLSPLSSRVQSLQLHHELELAHLCTSTDVNAGPGLQVAWQQRLNCQIQQMTPAAGSSASSGT